MRITSILAAFLAAASLILAQTALAAPMTNADVIKMSKSGLGEAIIVQSIDAAEPRFDTSANGLIELKQGGVSDAIMHRIIQRASKPTSTPAAAPAVLERTIPQASSANAECQFRASYNHIGIQDGEGFHDVGFSAASMQADVDTGSALLSALTGGLTEVKGKGYAVIDGKRSTVRVKSSQPVFLDLNADRGLNPGDLIKLVRLNAKKGKRFVAVAEASESLFTAEEKIAFPPDKLVPLRFDMTIRECRLEGKAMSVYKAVPLQPLVPGEYAIAYGEGAYYSFGVD